MSRSKVDIEKSLSVALQPSSCGRHLVRRVEPSSPFFYLGDTAWELPHRLNDQEAELYLTNRAKKGFNSVMIVIVAEHSGLEYPNREGHFPFLPAQSSASAKYVPDVGRPNPDYFAFIDRIVTLAATLGITITIVPTWGRYVNGGFHGDPIIFNRENAYEFGRYMGERYPFHPFVLGGDSVRYWNPNTVNHMQGGGSIEKLEIIDYGPTWEALAQGLRYGEKQAANIHQLDTSNYETLITYHSCQCWYAGYPEATASAQFPDADWLVLDCVQTGHYNGRLPDAEGSPGGGQAGGVSSEFKIWNGSGSYAPIRKMYATIASNGKPRPVLDLEAHYEATHHWFNYKEKLWTADDIRSGAWQGVFAGACGYTYGCNSIWQMHNGDSDSHPPIKMPTTAYTNWYLELDLPGAYYASILKTVLLSLPDFFTRRPDSTFILSDTNEPKTDDENGLDRLIQGLKADSWAMVHLPYGGYTKIDLSGAIGQCKSTYRAWWIDPRSGGRSPLFKGERKAIDGQAGFTSPTEGSLEHDWILLLETFSA